MSYDAIDGSKCSLIQACPFLNVIEFCPFENACDLLAYGSNDSLTLCSLTFNSQQKHSNLFDDGKPIHSCEKLATFDYKGMLLLLIVFLFHFCLL